MQEELDNVFGDDPERDLTVADLSKMKYLECCIKETLRLYPSIPIYSRSLEAEAVLDGHVLPKGTSIMIAAIALHRNPLVWEDPEEFRPERFLAESR